MPPSRHARRSQYPEDYQRLPQRIGAMVKRFDDGHVIATHAHERDQLLHSISGVMRLRTDGDALVVPPDRAVLIPAGLRHSVSIHGAVEMRTLYIAAVSSAGATRPLRVLSVSPLLRELIVALCEEPVVTAADTRGERIALLIEDELERAGELSLGVPLPRDPRLQKVCAALLAHPSDRRTLEAWSDVAAASARTLARLFERDIGMSFGEWRQRARMHHALAALSEGRSVAQVSRACGYRSPSAFTAAFQEVVGALPSDVSRG